MDTPAAFDSTTSVLPRAPVGDLTTPRSCTPRPPGVGVDYLVYGANDGYEGRRGSPRACASSGIPTGGRLAIGSSGRAYEPGATEIALEPGRRYLINVGSVGQPRDRDPRAAYALWDVDGRRVSIQRVAYDLATARRKILAAGLPRFLAERLTIGA